MAIKLKGSTDGSVTLEAPADTSPSGTNKTFSLPAADGTDGQVLSTNGSGALSFSSVPALAITEVDQWYLNTDQTSDGILTNLTRTNYPGSAVPIGTGMSVSSGVFTFPSTGKWQILGKVFFRLHDADNVSVVLEVTTDNSTYTIVDYALDGNNGTSGTRNGQGILNYFLDVTDTSLVKVRFQATSIATDSSVGGTTTHAATNFSFIRLGDT